MRKLLASAALALVGLLGLSGGPVSAGHMSPVIIDGVVNSGPGEEWDGHFLGTNDGGGNLPVDVFGYADASFLYVGYRADITAPGWADTCALSIPPNFYHKTPTTASWPDPAYTLFEMTYDAGGPTPDASQVVKQTDGTDWANAGDLPGNGVLYAWKFVTGGAPPTAACLGATSHENMAEFKIPLSLITYAGDNGKVRLFGQYWQYASPDAFEVTLPPPVPQRLPDLTCIKELKPGQPSPVDGGVLAYIIKCSNIGNVATPPPPTDVVLRDWPINSRFVSWTANTGVCSWNGIYLECKRRRMAPGEVWWVELKVKLPSPCTEVTNRGIVDPLDRIKETNEINNGFSRTDPC